MTLVVKDRIKETTTTIGTVNVALLGAEPTYRAFSLIGDGNTTYYAIIHRTLPEWEVGLGTYALAGTTLTRTTVLSSSNANAAVNFSAGTKDVICCLNTEQVVFVGITETVKAILDTPAFEIDPNLGTIQTITLGASRTPKGTNFKAGQSVTIMITAGAFTITWTDTTFGPAGVKWVGGTAPTLSATLISTVVLWKVGTQVYGKAVGDS